ncbi:MAG: multiheme c-type cytochrome [Terracidiphilus sp.]
MPLILAALIATAYTQAPDTAQNPASQTTREHLQHERWWPTKQFADQSQFAGSQACARCHGGIALSQSTTQMALTMMPAASSPVLQTHTGDIYRLGSYRYSVEKTGNSFKLKISDGTEERTEPLQWAFGSGTIAQSFEWWQNGQLYESRFNYFSLTHGFDRTPGRLQGSPVSMEMAVGRRVASFEARKCYACHLTALTDTEPLSRAQFFPGITCEGCHGPGREHIASEKSPDLVETHIVSPADLTPAKSVDFCGACHGTPKDVALMGMMGEITVRFPAYRLERSRCWGSNGDKRLTCFACHNPHRPLEHDPAAYDFACLRCHANGAAATSEPGTAVQHSCPVAKSRCTSCHMPRYTAGEIHYEFTDHDIRIVKANAPFPD